MVRFLGGAKRFGDSRKGCGLRDSIVVVAGLEGVTAMHRMWQAGRVSREASMADSPMDGRWQRR